MHGSITNGVSVYLAIYIRIFERFSSADSEGHLFFRNSLSLTRRIFPEGLYKCHLRNQSDNQTMKHSSPLRHLFNEDYPTPKLFMTGHTVSDIFLYFNGFPVECLGIMRIDRVFEYHYRQKTHSSVSESRAKFLATHAECERQFRRSAFIKQSCDCYVVYVIVLQ
jgi:hypothetical protein